ncbi:hypothetical protein YC2023_011882 [Brassica napus]
MEDATVRMKPMQKRQPFSTQEELWSRRRRNCYSGVKADNATAEDLAEILATAHRFAICLSNHVTRKAPTVHPTQHFLPSSPSLSYRFTQQLKGEPVPQELLDRLCELIAVLAGGAATKYEALKEEVLAMSLLVDNPLAS